MSAVIVPIENAKMPQLEDGYTRIANELFDAILGSKLNHAQKSLMFAIVRKTYGYNKKEDDVSASQLGELCGISRQHVTTMLNELAAMNVINKRLGVYGCVVGVQKDYANWNILSKGRTSPKNGRPVQSVDSPSPKNGQVDSPKNGHTKDNLPKDNQQKTTRVKRAAKIPLDSWLQQKKESGIKPIPEDHAVFAYADKIGLPIDYVRLCWLKFKTKYSGGTKCYADWSLAFLNCVKENYYKLWFDRDGSWQLTTAGIQLQKEMREAK